MRTKTCKQCKAKKPADKMKIINMSNFCDMNCAITYGIEASKKLRAKKEKADNKKHSERKQAFRLTDTNHQHKLTQAVFNKLRVLEEKQWFYDRGLEPECISCGKQNMDWCCGHFKTRGSQGNLRYDRKNTFLQCNRYCNKALSGNIYGNKTTRGYINGLAARFGEEDAKVLIDYCESHTEVKRWTGEELVENRKQYSLEIKKLNSK